MGDQNDERKEGTTSRTLAHNMGGGSFRIRTLADVRAKMRNGNTRILSDSCQGERNGDIRSGMSPSLLSRADSLTSVGVMHSVVPAKKCTQAKQF